MIKDKMMAMQSTNISAKRKPHPNAYDWNGWTRPEHICKVCGNKVERAVTVFGERKGDVAVYCRLHVPRIYRESTVDSAKNPFENFTLQHVRDENGNKVTVNSIKELRAAEKRYNFALAVASDDGGKADAPPQHESWAGNIAHKYEKKFNRDPEAYKSPKAAEGVSAGMAKSADDTLANRPNPV